MDQQTSTATTTTSPIIDVIHAGTQVPHDALVELTTRSVFFLNQIDWNEIYPQLALSQTTAMRLGVHDRGGFTELRELQFEGPSARVRTETQQEPDVVDMSGQHQEMAIQMVRLTRVLQVVQELAIARGRGPAGSFSLVCEDGELRVYARRRDGEGDETDLTESCLPPEVLARFEQGFESHIDQDQDSDGWCFVGKRARRRR